jgi:defect in organelle trafficking protein DotC
MLKQHFSIFFVFVSLFISGCKTPPKSPGRPADIPALNKKETKMSGLRFESLKEAAMSVGSQAGLAWRSERINRNLKREEKILFEVFNFQAMVLNHNVLPPVLEEGKNALHLDNNETIRLADHIYRIIAPPRFITAPPTWRDYLWMSYDKPDFAQAYVLRPRNKEERAFWNKYVKIGWDNGVKLANDIFEANLNRLRRDYEGMALYKVLLAQNMVTPPYVAKTDLGITGDENEMRIGDQVLRISATSKLNLKGKTWKPAIYNRKQRKKCSDLIEKITQ